jgi:hypothetical protein
MLADINPIRYNDNHLGLSARYEVTECGNSAEDYVEIRVRLAALKREAATNRSDRA